jgi:tetratricopeptide (TPR) repeat protein
LARAHVLVGAHQDARTHLSLAIELSRRLGDLLGEALSHSNLASVLDRQDRPDEALEHAQRALAVYRSTGDKTGQSRLLNTIGWLHTRTGDYQQALTHSQEALELCHSLDDNDVLEAAIQDSLGHAHHHLGEHRQAIECYHHALDLSRKTRQRYEQAGTLTRLGDTHDATGDHDAARHAWEQAQTLLDDLQHPDAEKVRQKLREASNRVGPDTSGFNGLARLAWFARPVGG